MKPKIRIKGYNEDWEKNCIGKFFKERNERSSVGELLSVTMNNGVVKASSTGRQDNSSDDKSHYKYVEVNDIAYNSMRMWQGACGCSEYRGIVSPAYTVMTPSNEVDPGFFVRLFKNRKTLTTFRLNSQGLTSDTWNLKYPTLSQISLYAPSSINEQQDISKTLGYLDKKIELTISKIESLKQTRKACLLSMFPSLAESKPKIRFAGFTEEWQKVLLSECLSVSNEKNVSNIYGKEDVLSVSDDFGVCNQIKLLGRSYAGKSVSNYGVLKNGQVVYTKSPLKAKPFGIIKTNHGETGIVSTLYAIYSVKENICPDYIEVYFDDVERMNKYIHPLVNKGAKNDMKVSSENALKGYVRIPSYAEQQKIADYFKAIDKQIALQNSCLEKLQQIKAACLDKMFI